MQKHYTVTITENGIGDTAIVEPYTDFGRACYRLTYRGGTSQGYGTPGAALDAAERIILRSIDEQATRERERLAQWNHDWLRQS